MAVRRKLYKHILVAIDFSDGSRRAFEQAVATAAEWAQTGDQILLSPACASFDMYSGYEQRGEVFIDAVVRLLA